jgi:hypothetical protein
MTASFKQALVSSYARHDWIEKATAALRTRFAELAYTVPAEVRVSIGFPKGSGSGNSTKIGQCWAPAASADSYSEIFVSPELNDGARIMGVLAHELVHATVGCEAGHKAPFKRCAETIGLTGKMTATTETTEFNAWATTVMARIGAYPAGGMITGGRKKQSTRLLKCECTDCGYTARVSAKWVAEGTPICPIDDLPMHCDAL